MVATTPKLGLRKAELTDNIRDFETGAIAGGGQHANMNDLDNAVLSTGATAGTVLRGTGPGTAGWGAVQASDLYKDVRPSAGVYHNVAQSIATNTLTTLAMNSERWDHVDVMHDPVTNNSRLICNHAGKYRATANVSFDTNATGYRFLDIVKNGGARVALVTCPAISGDYTSLCVTVEVDLAANDYLEVRVLQTSGGALNVPYNADYTPNFTLTRVA